VHGPTCIFWADLTPCSLGKWPGARSDAAAWAGAGGRLFLFGGHRGADDFGMPAELNDLWACDAADAAAVAWRWVGGPATTWARVG
jgi:hypothetical protein